MKSALPKHLIEGLIVRSLYPLRELLFDDEVTEIVINGHRNVFFEKAGILRVADAYFDSAHDLDLVIKLLAQHAGRALGPHDFEVDTAIEGPPAIRFHANFASSTPRGACLTLRRIARDSTSLSDLIHTKGSLSLEAAEFLLLAVKQHKNILISGGTGSGKTTLLRCLCEGIPDHERIVLIEDTAELSFRQPDVAALLTRPPDVYGEGAITIRDLFRSSLRLRPDRVIIGEIRGAEAFDLLQSLGSGHSGALCTIHADSPALALSRIHALASMSGLPIPSAVLHRQIEDVIHYIVQVSRLMNGARAVTSVARVAQGTGENWNVMSVFERDPNSLDARLTWSGIDDPWLAALPQERLATEAPHLAETRTPSGKKRFLDERGSSTLESLLIFAGVVLPFAGACFLMIGWLLSWFRSLAVILSGPY